MGTLRATRRTYLYEAHSWNNKTVATVRRDVAGSGSFGVGPTWNACTDGVRCSR